MKRKLRIYKGLISSLFVFVPYLVTVIKFAFFYHGCMDGFGIYLVSFGVILFIGAPLCLISCLVSAWEHGAFATCLNKRELIYHRVGNTLAVLALLLVLWMLLAQSQGGTPFLFR